MHASGLTLAGSVVASAAATWHSGSGQREKGVGGGSRGEGEMSGGGWGGARSGGKGKMSGGGWGEARSRGKGKVSGGGWGGARRGGEGTTSSGGWRRVGSVGRQLGLSGKTVSGGLEWSWWSIDWFRCCYQLSHKWGQERRDEESHVILSCQNKGRPEMTDWRQRPEMRHQRQYVRR